MDLMQQEASMSDEELDRLMRLSDGGEDPPSDGGDDDDDDDDDDPYTEFCCVCDVEFSSPILADRQEDHKTFYCPNGHAMEYTRPRRRQSIPYVWILVLLSPVALLWLLAYSHTHFREPQPLDRRVASMICSPWRYVSDGWRSAIWFNDGYSLIEEEYNSIDGDTIQYRVRFWGCNIANGGKP